MLNENNEILAKFKSIQIASEVTGISRNRISRCARKIRKQIIEKGKVYKFEYDSLPLAYAISERSNPSLANANVSAATP